MKSPSNHDLSYFAPATRVIDDWLNTIKSLRPNMNFAVGIHHSDGKYQRSVNNTHYRSMSGDDILNIGSIAKMLTATVILMLVQEGLLGLDDLVVDRLPWIQKHQDRKFRTVTIKQLLSHTSGLARDGCSTDHWQLRQPFPDKNKLHESVLDSNLVTYDINNMKYSNLAYGLLGEIAESATGKSYQQLCKKYLTTPLSLASTYTGNIPADNQSPVSPSYSRPMAGKSVELPFPTATNAFTPASGWYTTLSDLAKITHALHNGKLVGDSLYQEMIDSGPHHWIPPEHRQIQYGLGVLSYPTNLRNVYGHTGAFIGQKSACFHDKDSNITVCIASTGNPNQIDFLLDGIFDILQFHEQHAQSPTPQDLERYNLVLNNLLSTKRIIATKNKIASISLDSEMPFVTEETLELIADDTMIITNAHELSSRGEKVLFNRDSSGEISTVKYAGMSMWPQKSVS